MSGCSPLRRDLPTHPSSLVFRRRTKWRLTCRTPLQINLVTPFEGFGVSVESTLFGDDGADRRYFGLLMKIFVLKESSSFPCGFRWAWREVVVGSIETWTPFLTMVGLPYNTGYFQGHLLTKCWENLWQSGLVTEHLRHSLQQFQLLSVEWSSELRGAWCSNVMNRLPTAIWLTIIRLVPVVSVQSWMLLWACCCLQLLLQCCLIRQLWKQ